MNDPAQDKREGAASDFDPAERHSGEGLESVRPRLARILADSALRSADRQTEAMTSRIPPDSAEVQADSVPARTPDPK